jgi:signal transduction histidine kinase
LAKIKISVKNLIEILSDVTEINKVDSGKATVTLEQVDVVNLINDMIDEVKQGYPVSAKISFTSEKQSLVLNSDKKLLRQVFINLINNAVKYTDPKKSIYISLEHQPDLTIFKVEDEGIGIPGEDFDTLFEPFMRSKNTGKIKGTGLGLSILKRAVDLLGGRVDFSSTLNVGSTFTVYLPNDISIIQEDEIKHEFNFL